MFKHWWVWVLLWYGMVCALCAHVELDGWIRARVDIAVPTHRPPAVPHGCGHRFLVGL